QGGEIVGDLDACLHAQERAGILPDAGRAGTVQCDGEGEILAIEYGFDEHAAHAAVCPRDCDTHSVVSFVVGLAQRLGSAGGGCRRGFRGARARVLGCFRRAGIGSLERLTVRLRVSFPAYQGIAFEPDTEAALFRLAVARLAVIGIVPAVAAEDVLQGGRAQQETHLFACHARLQPLDLFGSDPVALLYVRAIRKPHSVLPQAARASANTPPVTPVRSVL